MEPSTCSLARTSCSWSPLALSTWYLVCWNIILLLYIYQSLGDMIHKSFATIFKKKIVQFQYEIMYNLQESYYFCRYQSFELTRLTSQYICFILLVSKKKDKNSFNGEKHVINDLPFRTHETYEATVNLESMLTISLESTSFSHITYCIDFHLVFLNY